MLPKDSTSKKIVTKLSSHIPSFTDIFDEETFYICFFCLTIASIVAAVYFAKRVTIKDAGHVD